MASFLSWYKPSKDEIRQEAYRMLYSRVIRDIHASRQGSIANICKAIISLSVSNNVKVAAVWCVIWTRSGEGVYELISRFKEMPMYSTISAGNWRSGLDIARRYTHLASIPDQVELG